MKRNFDADGRPTSFSSDNKGYLGFTDWLQTFEQAYQPAVSGTPTFFTPKQTDVNMNSIASVSLLCIGLPLELFLTLVAPVVSFQGFKGTTSSTLSTLFISAFEGSVSNPSVQVGRANHLALVPQCLNDFWSSCLFLQLHSLLWLPFPPSLTAPHPKPLTSRWLKSLALITLRVLILALPFRWRAR